jgi:hypothetical protein
VTVVTRAGMTAFSHRAYRRRVVIGL